MEMNQGSKQHKRRQWSFLVLKNLIVFKYFLNFNSYWSKVNILLFSYSCPQCSHLVIINNILKVVAVISKLCPTLCNPKDWSVPGSSILHYLPEFAQFHVHHVLILIVSFSTALFSFAFCLSQHQSLSTESAAHIRWPKYCSFSFSISPSNEYSGLISFRIDWFDLLAVQETLKSPLQHYSSKASILWQPAFVMVQLSYPYITTRKTVALPIRTLVGKVVSLLFNMLFWFVIAFLPRSKLFWFVVLCCVVFFFSWLRSLSVVLLEPKNIKSVTASRFSPCICHEVMGLDAMIMAYLNIEF